MFFAKWGGACGTNYLTTTPSPSRASGGGSLGLTIYPNPADGELSINMNVDLKNTELSIYDGLGKKVLEKNNKDKFTSTKINTTAFNNGLYQIVLKQNGSILDSKKLVVAH
jgi:hypothetical protein